MKTMAYILVLGLLFILSGCNKFLEEKSDKKLAVPHTLEDLQALLDDVIYVGGQTASESEVSTDDYYVKENDMASLPESEQALYYWSAELPDDERNGQGWRNGYREIYYCNLVLEGLTGLTQEERGTVKAHDIMGQALIKRAAAMLAMAEIWTMGYDNKDVDSPYGLPIRQNTNFNEKSKRGTLAETYDFIQEDLLKAKDLLTLKSISKYRPTKAAAYGYLARLYLFKNDYVNAAIYSDSCISYHGGKLLDFGTLDISKRYGMPLPENNPEVIFLRTLTSFFILGQTVAKISPDLLNNYDSNDYRLNLFFYPNSDGSKRFKGSYTGSSGLFCGIALDEMYLIKIEALLQTGKFELAKIVTKEFVKNRYNLSSGKILNLDSMSNDELLNFIIQERRRELLMRGLRWSDIKRLNKMGSNLGFERKESNIKLPPNDLRFAIPIPQNVVDLTGMLKNER